MVLQNRVAGGRWQVEGYLRCTVFYQSEEPGMRLLRTEQKFAFEKSVEMPAGQYAEGPAQVWGEPEYCNCRAVSEHRIDLRGRTSCAAVAVRKELELLTSLADCGIEQYTRTMQGLQCAVTEEKTLTAETVAALPGAGERSGHHRQFCPWRRDPCHRASQCAGHFADTNLQPERRQRRADRAQQGATHPAEFGTARRRGRHRPLCGARCWPAL